ncbi:MAG: Ferrichrome transport ATP-binding protein FhuC [Cytophagales bacterium]|jgi:iron complex transport system ATP-binding protein|nr:ABC transporter ATP-binding protein [Bacteroidota bacterium]MBS1981911.1 ABC transporter ATP-binding protein [Bacteroidota bacterium]WHZ07535.1 MAG: Ferrichrome transport ATP-binding protein FhuC [Cytophagales bacterium]
MTEILSNQLVTKKISIGFTDQLLFHELDLHLQAGKLTCLMGPNGIGKSTLIKTLAGLQHSLAGELIQPGSNNIALVLTDKVTAMNMTVYDLVSYGRYPHVGWGISFSPHDHQIVEQSICEVHINSLSGKKLEELSDGQLQLAMIARALAQETPIILLDEPTAHLDLNNRVEIMKLLRKLSRKKNIAILVATHELDLALHLADIVWLAAHKKITVGFPEDLVLDNSFDEIFQFKGFDLKTGKIQHELFRKQKINLIGSGHEFLWTKNALEREGYTLTEGGAPVEIQTGITPQWKFGDSIFSTLQQLITAINSVES